MLDAVKAMPRYLSYKDSGVEWLGEIPEHWEIKPLKHTLKLISEKTFSSQSSLPYIGMENIESWTSHFLESKTEVEGLANKFESHDILFGKLRPYLAKVALAKYSGICSTEILVYRPKNNADFFKYLLISSSFIKLVDASTYGSKMPRASSGFIGIQRLPLPYQEEQTTIVTYLDRKTVQIDQAVQIKQQQIALLKERKQILIQNAVTRGLDPHTPLRDSGVEWIGEIPAHWIVTKLGHYAVVTNGSTPSRDVPRYWESGSVPWLASGKVNEFEINTPSELITESAFRECSLRLYPVGTIIIGIVGQGKTRGTSAVLNLEAAINQNVAGIVPKGGLLSRFLHRYLVQAYEQVRNYGKGSNQEALNCEIVRSIKIAVPPLDEQTAIAIHIETQSAKIDRAIALQQQQIERLKEYKATLINSAVTGKIKVPGVVEGESKEVA